MSANARSVWLPPADWSAAYDNRAAVGQDAVEGFIADITAKASAFRAEMTRLGRARLDQAYGDRPRQRFDLFLPNSSPTALAVFVHGGYWRTFDKSYWSHLAAGALARDAAVAIPSYTLCPEARISEITQEITTFLHRIAAEIDGPIHLAGHSAGGHLVARLASSVLDRGLGERIAKVVSISGVHDLRPLLRTEMNVDLRLDLKEARAESPTLLAPVDGVDLTCWAGADELPAFRLQNRLLAEMWGMLGAKAEAIEAEGKNHFTVVEDLAAPESELTRTLLA
ncbi:MAG: alpha/beta hydrolase [Alphaproteobacteria bacterium]|nr:alpha/beta hydrolase [Alphaproteobacteria bacterium]